MTVNIGIIGCGPITRFRYAPEYAANPQAVIMGFFDPVTVRAREMAGLYGGEVYETYEAMLRDSSIDAVSGCTANVHHAPITIDALLAG